MNSDEKQQSSAPTAVKARWRWTFRKTVWLWSSIGILAPLLWCVWPFLGWARSVTISKETTYLTEPVGADGYIDYAAWLYGWRQEIGDHLLVDETWRRLEALEGKDAAEAWSLLEVTEGEDTTTSGKIVYRSAIDAQFEDPEEKWSPAWWAFTDDELPRLRRLPWQSDEYPRVAQAIDENGDWYDYVVSTFSPVSAIGYPTPTGNPWDSSLANILLPGVQRTQTLHRRFQLRAAHRFGEGEVALALDDLVFAYRLSSRDRSFLMSLQYRMDNEKEASHTVIIGLLSAEKIDAAAIDRIQKLPTAPMVPLLVEALHSERMMSLEEASLVRKTARFDGSLLVDLSGLPETKRWLVSRRLYLNVDWNEVLKAENAMFDELLEALGNRGFSAANQRFQLLLDAPEADAAKARVLNFDLMGPTPKTEDYILAVRGAHRFRADFVKVTAANLRRRVVQIAARLAVWKIKHGEYPGSLDELKTLSEFSATPPDIMTDPFTGGPLHYESSQDGFELRSPGANGVVDSMMLDELEAQTPDDWDHQVGDYLWRWPLQSAPQTP